MAGQSDPVATPAGASPQPALLGTLASLSCEALAPMLEDMFGACEKLLFELARSAAGTYDEQRLLDFRRELARKKAAISTHFVERMMSEFLRFQHPRAPAGKAGAETLELVAQEQIEKQLLVAGGVSRARAEWQPVLSQLGERMLALAPSGASEGDNPLDPGRIALAFLDACQQIETDMNSLKLLCKQFDAHVLGNLENFYRSSNQVLIDARVLPYFVGTPARAAGSARDAREASVGTRPAAPEVGSTTPLSPRQDEAATIGAAGTAFGELSALLRQVRGSASPAALAGAMRVGETQLSGTQLVSLLSDAQCEAGWLGAGGSTTPDIRGTIGAIAARHGALGLGGAESDVVDIVTMIFDTIAEDANLPLPIQVLLARLQLPVLKIALVDKGFFSDRAHPARQLLNAIARAGKGWDCHDKEARDSLLQQLHDLVQQLAEDSRAGSEAFGQALERLQSCVERAEARAVKIERRTSEKAAADARLAAARDAVHQVMKEKLEGHELPVPLLEFFAADWQRVLQLFYLRRGTGSPEWQGAVQMIDELGRSVTAPRDAEARGALARSLASLYQRLEEALAQTQSHTEEARARVEVIRELHRDLLAPASDAAPACVVPIERARIQPPPMVPPRNPAETPARPETAPEPPAGVLSFESLKRADDIAVGTWFEYVDRRSGSARRCKLSARVDETRMLLFCDRNGLLVWEKPRKAFAYALQTGEWRLIEDSPLIERTMARIADNLRQQAGAA